MSLYFSGWARLVRQNKLVNRYLRFKYFREMKKLLTLRKKRELSEMLVLTHEKLRQVELCSKILGVLKKEGYREMEGKFGEQGALLNAKNKELVVAIGGLRMTDQQVSSRLGVLKIGGYLKMCLQQSFSHWQSVNFRAHKLGVVMHMLHTKETTSRLCSGFRGLQQAASSQLRSSMSNKIRDGEASYSLMVKENSQIEKTLKRKPASLKKYVLGSVVRKTIRTEKELVRKYLYKFASNGFKLWKINKMYQRVNGLV
jgi:hypothetical protein